MNTAIARWVTPAVGTGAAGVAVVVSTSALRWSAVPFGWLAGLSAAALIAVALLMHDGVWKILAINLALVLVAVGALEFYLYARQSNGRTIYEQTAPYRRPHPLYGVVGVPGAESQVSTKRDGRVEWAATYRLDAHGLRKTPVLPAPVGGCVVFFGCSFTFGDGVDNEDTMPFRVTAKTDGRFGAINLGVGGAGAQQMLAQLQEGLVQQVSPCAPSAGIYTALPHHVYRAAGKPARHNFGPRYELANDGSLVRTGQIGDTGLDSRIVRRLVAQLRKSYIYIELTDWPALTENDVARYIAIVRESQHLFLQQYPSATFDVLLWDDVPFGETALYRQVLQGLRQAGLRVHPVRDILPGYAADPGAFALSAADRHPNARAYDILADWLVNELLPARRPN